MAMIFYFVKPSIDVLERVSLGYIVYEKCSNWSKL